MPTKTSILSLPALLTTIACGGPESPAQRPAPETGTTVSGLCTDGPADATLQFSNDYSTSAFAHSPLTTDNYDQSGCTDRWVLEVQNVNQATEDFRIWARWPHSDLYQLTQSSCAAAFSSIQLYEYKANWICNSNFCYPSYGWSQYGDDITLQGVWENGYCRMKTHSSSYPVFSPSFFRSKVRIAVKNFGLALFFPVFKKANAGFHSDVYYFD